MTRGFHQYDVSSDTDAIYIVDRESEKAYTFKIESMQLSKGFAAPSSRINNEDRHVLRALAEALQQAGILPMSASDAELKATKAHLEDMRKLAGAK